MDSLQIKAQPILLEKANNQAQIIANSIKRKLGMVIETSSISHLSPSPALLDYFSVSEDILKGLDDDENPFELTKKVVIEYLFRYQLLN